MNRATYGWQFPGLNLLRKHSFDMIFPDKEHKQNLQIFSLRFWTQKYVRSKYYPEISGGNFNSALLTFKQWLSFKMRVHYGISIILM